MVPILILLRVQVEVHPADDGERAAYRRVSLPGMNGALEKNISELNEWGAQVLHSVDATDLEGTLRTQGVEGRGVEAW